MLTCLGQVAAHSSGSCSGQPPLRSYPQWFQQLPGPESGLCPSQSGQLPEGLILQGSSTSELGPSPLNPKSPYKLAGRSANLGPLRTLALESAHATKPLAGEDTT